MSAHPETPQAIFLKPNFQVGAVETAHAGLAVVLLADYYRFWPFGQGVDEDVGVSGHEELAPAGCLDQQVCQLGDQVRVESQLRLLYSDELGRLGVEKDRQ